MGFHKYFKLFIISKYQFISFSSNLLSLLYACYFYSATKITDMRLTTQRQVQLQFQDIAPFTCQLEQSPVLLPLISSHFPCWPGWSHSAAPHACGSHWHPQRKFHLSILAFNISWVHLFSYMHNFNPQSYQAGVTHELSGPFSIVSHITPKS